MVGTRYFHDGSINGLFGTEGWWHGVRSRGLEKIEGSTKFSHNETQMSNTDEPKPRYQTTHMNFIGFFWKSFECPNNARVKHATAHDARTGLCGLTLARIVCFIPSVGSICSRKIIFVSRNQTSTTQEEDSLLLTILHPTSWLANTLVLSFRTMHATQTTTINSKAQTPESPSRQEIPCSLLSHASSMRPIGGTGTTSSSPTAESSRVIETTTLRSKSRPWKESRPPKKTRKSSWLTTAESTGGNSESSELIETRETHYWLRRRAMMRWSRTHRTPSLLARNEPYSSLIHISRSCVVQSCMDNGVCMILCCRRSIDYSLTLLERKENEGG